MKEILREIGIIARALNSISNIEFKEYDLTKGQYLYLVRICEHPGIIQEKLAEMIKVDRTTAARAIQKLETNGFIVKKDDEHNKKLKNSFQRKKGTTYFLLSKGNMIIRIVWHWRDLPKKKRKPFSICCKESEKYRKRLGISKKGKQEKLLIFI